MNSQQPCGTLLLVDDEPGILRALQRIFLAEGHTVFTAGGGLDGLNILEQHPIDVIISDMRMPIMDGASFLKQVAERWPSTKRILLTGYADINSAMSAINEGKIDYYISKPWKNDEINKIVANMLDNKCLADENRFLQKKLAEQNEELKLLNTYLEDKVTQRTVELHQSYTELQQTHSAAVEVLLSMQELHEGTFKGYCRGVATHAKLLAEALQLSEKEIQVIYLAAMLHNLGKSGLPGNIMYKPFMQLTTSEHQEYIQYPLLGATVLSAFPSLSEVTTAILSHREQFDGKGYPNQLVGDAIPLPARIIGLAVDYNELQYGLMFRDKYPAQLALQFMAEHPQRYDPKLAALFTKTIKQIPKEQVALMESLYDPSQLEPGMILSRDLVSKNGFNFLYKGYCLTAEVIEKIQILGDIPIYIYHKDQDQSLF